ncbi:DUF5686 family protein [soil metagenome]
MRSKMNWQANQRAGLILSVGLMMLSFFSMNAQITLSGTVVDAFSEPMAFVNVHLKGTNTGTTTAIDGKYTLTLNLERGQELIEFSFVGYKPMTYSIDQLKSLRQIKMISVATALEEVEVIAGENPANGIVRKVIANKNYNDPAQLNSYSFNCYNKTIYTASGLDDDSNPADPSIEKALRYGHLAMLESYSSVKHLRPNLKKETVLKSKVTGWDDPKLAMLSSSFQPFAFYEEQVSLFGSLYVNPISDNSLKRYEFFLQDTVYTGRDTTYILSFEPSTKILDAALNGLLYINTDHYAIENVIAHPADTTMKVDFRIQQQYRRIDGRWFPTELYTRYVVKDGGLPIKNDSIPPVKKKGKVVNKPKTKYVPLVLKNQSYFSSIRINPELSSKDFDLFNVDYKTDEMKEVGWSELRPDSLSRRETQTYYNYDTLPVKVKRLMNKVFDLSLSLADGKVPVGKISILPKHLLRFNRYENVALGIGLSTNDRFSRRFQLQGYTKYGFGDNALKYGGSLQINVDRDKGNNVVFRYSQDIDEPGRVDYLKSSGIDLTSGGDAFRKFLTNRMDSIRKFTLEYNFRPAPFTQVSLFSNHELRNPTYPYAFAPAGLEARTAYSISEVGLNFRFLFKESITRVAGFQMITGNSFPLITARVSRAFDNVAGGEYSFTKFDARINHVFHTIGFGKTSILINVSKVWGDNVPYSYLNFGNAFRINENNSVSVYASGYFQTMRLYEFTSDTYGQISLDHNFGTLFTALKGLSKPELVIVQNIAYGSLKNPSVHQGVEIKTMEKGYYESGIMLNNLLRIDSKLYWLGYGAGVFYRYGPYASPIDNQNLVFIISTSVKL